jgi:hypothetical protein
MTMAWTNAAADAVALAEVMDVKINGVVLQ